MNKYMKKLYVKDLSEYEECTCEGGKVWYDEGENEGRWKECNDCEGTGFRDIQVNIDIIRPSIMELNDELGALLAK